MSVKTFSDQEVIRLIKLGDDAKVLHYLYDTVLPKVRQLVVKNNGDADTAYDLFQEAIMRFYAKVKKNEFREEGNVPGFIFTISKNLWLNQLNQEKRITKLDQNYDVPDEGNQEAEIISEERAFLITQLFEKLGDRCKDLLNYTIYHKLSMKEISIKMGFSSENVAKTKHYKCKKRLVALVKDNQSAQEMLRN